MAFEKFTPGSEFALGSQTEILRNQAEIKKGNLRALSEETQRVWDEMAGEEGK